MNKLINCWSKTVEQTCIKTGMLKALGLGAWYKINMIYIVT